MKSRKNTILNMYFLEKLTPAQISRKLKISKSAVTQVLQKDNRYFEVKSERIEQNKESHIQRTKDYMKEKRSTMQFEQNVDNLVLKNMHNQASKELSKVKKLSNMAYRNWNTSAFDYNNKRHGYEFKDELGRSFDVPKFIKSKL